MKITEDASKYAKARLDKRGTPNALIRLGVKGGGCVGYSYVVEFEDSEPREQDSVLEYVFVVDKKSLKILDGTTVRHEKTIMYDGLKFDNPNIESTCGCGTSFTIKKKLPTL